LIYGEVKKLLRYIHVHPMHLWKIKVKNGFLAKISEIAQLFIPIEVLLKVNLDFTVLLSVNWPSFPPRS
jgi:hypothetical protein